MRSISLWKTNFLAPASAMPALLDDLDELALSVAVFEDEANELEETVRWRIDLTFDHEPALDKLEAGLQEIVGRHGFTLRLAALEPIPEADWLAVTAAAVKPLRLGRFFVHGAAARSEVPADAIGIEVEAGLAFGSGEHQTTQACLDAMEGLTGRRFARVLDLGTGSGILAIAAAHLWPEAVVTAVDNDPVAARVTAENALLNGVGGRITAGVSEGWRSDLVRLAAPYDLVLANILADPLIVMATDLAPNLASGGVVVLSGFIGRDLPRVLGAHEAQGLRELERVERDAWRALVLTTA
ncbi:[LSU ribosomal protein L11P]-lysine N-methyltransferase [Arboricoccus pini]|uniref:Ribosomal protein L11 methyltransferase n=1 Tax=Arboricoccus pini TaxID=1963835 RepID=A0A212RD54_9PROT|nr:50S ribosomal protein L11 methyltransferase [Arboricoccus pini]SNB70021.1 [LSU ribosomal protein L11P]-lysine N-methyltransferase [Arboricoccus pini]